jgi:hypothetical protein
MLPFNTSAFSNTLGATDRAAQRKALVAPFKEDFEGKAEDVLQHIAAFTQRCEETGVIEDFKFIEEEHPPRPLSTCLTPRLVLLGFQIPAALLMAISS